MVMFHSYVSLPEGISQTAALDKSSKRRLALQVRLDGGACSNAELLPQRLHHKIAPTIAMGNLKLTR